MFVDGTTVLGNVALSTVGNVTSASLSTSGLTVGAHQVKAYYSGDGKFASSVGTLTQTVNASVTLTRTIATSITREKKYDLDFEVTAFPNPANHFFNVTIRSNNQEEKIGLRVVDVLGRVVENRGSVTEGKTFKIGETYRPGIYFVEIIQGRERRMLKLIKQSE